MILVIGSAVVPAAQIDEAHALSQQHVLRSRAEPGCISHAVHRDAENPNRLVFVEKWTDGAALKAHFAVPESRAFAGALGALCSERPQIEIYQATPVKP